MDPNLMRHYESELTFLREMGAEFAAEFPKVAARLDIANAEVADPYVERLLEGFAFLTARIQLKMEAEFPTFTQSLLQMVYPHYFAPTPSMAIVKFTPDPGIKDTPVGVDLPAGLELRSLLGTEDQTNCEFRTAHKLRLLPIEVVEAEYIGSPAAVATLGLPDQPNTRAAIRLKLRTFGNIPISKLALETLSFYLGGPAHVRCRGRRNCRAARSRRPVSTRRMRCCRVRRSRSTAIGCCRNTSRCRSGFCFSISEILRSQRSAAPPTNSRSSSCSIGASRRSRGSALIICSSTAVQRSICFQNVAIVSI